MNFVNYIITGDYVLTMNDKMDVIKNGAVAIKDNKIVDVDQTETILQKYAAKEILKRPGHVIMPGFINTHTHASMVYFRGLADDLPLKEWLNDHIWPAENKMLAPEFVYDAAKLACLEMIRGGTTSFIDMYFFENEVAKATKEMGMRAMLGSTIFDFPNKMAKTPAEYLKIAEDFVSGWQNDELITSSVAPHSLYACSLELVKEAQKIAEKYKVPLQIHLAEPEWEPEQVMQKYGKRPAEILFDIGLFENHVIAAHAIWLNDNEISILAKNKVNVAHCIESNLKIAAGIMPMRKMLEAGVAISFATDGAVSNNDLDLLSEIAMAAKFHKLIAEEPTMLSAKEALSLAFKNGAKAMASENKIGKLQKGCLADLITMNFLKPHLVPMFDVYSHLVYAASRGDVETVMINGKLVLNEKKVLICDENEIIKTALKWRTKMLC